MASELALRSALDESRREQMEAERENESLSAQLREAQAEAKRLRAAIIRLRDTAPGDWQLVCNGEAFNEACALSGAQEDE